jgi:energy-coupling factor transporter ATP-binding protein EcfA2
MMLDIWFATGMELKDGRWIPGNHGAQDSITWETLVDALTFDEIPFERMADHVKDLKGDEADKPWKKGDGCWIPALLKTDAEGTPLGRKKDSIVHYSCIVLDIDEGGDAAAVEAALQARDLAFIIHSTYRHNRLAEGTDRFRVVVPLDRPVEGETQYKAVLGQVALLAGGGEFPAGFDPASRNYSQAFWFPSYPPERANQSFRITNTGNPYEWHSPDLLDGNDEYDPQLPNPGDEVDTRQPVTVQRQLGTKPKVSKGKRNTVLHDTLHDYLRSEPSLPEWEDFKLTVLAINNDMFTPPLVPAEALRTARSVYDRHVNDHPEKVAFYTATAVEDFKAEPVEWLIPGQVLRGHLTVLQGSPGVGKSTLFFHWAKLLADKGKVSLIGKPEDDPSTLKKRFMAAEIPANRKVLAIDDRAMRQLPFGIGLLRKQIEYYGAELVFIDAVKSWMPTDLSKQNDGALRECLEPLAKLAIELKVGIVISRHLTKDSNNIDAMARGDGGQAYTAVARCTLMVTGGSKPHPRFPNSVLVSIVKNNLFSELATWAYPRDARLIPLDTGGDEAVPYLQKCHPVEGLTPDQILREVSPLHQKESAVGNCAADIKAALEAAGGSKEAAVLRDEILAMGHSEATYKRTTKQLGEGQEIKAGSGQRIIRLLDVNTL